MKNLSILFSSILLIGMISLVSCNSSSTADTIMQNEEMRTAIFEEIANNEQMMTEFMDVMTGNEHAQMMMKNHEGMMGMMQGDHHMMDDHNAMMKTMMSDTDMMGEMMQSMHTKGMMSKECLESVMANMDEHAMKMNMDQAETSKE